MLLVRLEDWKESLSLPKRGCGCLVSIGISCLCLAFMDGALMGDYFGPPEGVERDHQMKARTITASLAGIVVLDSWFVTGSRRR